jgi:cysteine desulfurase
VRLYLDYNATAPCPPEVVDAVAAALRDDFGNPSSVHAFGQRAKTALDQARIEVAALLDGDPSEIIFTSGGTEADNLALRGAFEASARTGRRSIVTTGIEHEAVLNTVRALERHGAVPTVLTLGERGVLNPTHLAGHLSDETAIVSIMLANNEIGTIQPVRDVAALAHSHGAVMHTDAVQAVGKIPVSVRELGVDLLTLSAHKFGGPKGVGALWVRRGVRLTTQATGGRQVGLGVAARLARQALVDRGTLASLRDRLEQTILTTIPGTTVNGDRLTRVPNTTNISFDGLEAESLLIALDLEGIAVSTGSACSSGTLEPSHVLRAMGLPHARARNALRFSLGPSTTQADVDLVAAKLPALVAKLRRLGRTAEALR